MNPSRRKENKLKRAGYKYIAGVDEAGRGSWAGPLVAAAVIMPPRVRIIGLKDSKQLSSRQREKIFLKIVDRALAWSIGMASEKIIDQKGLTYANLLAMEQAVKKLKPKPNYLLVDAFDLKRLKTPSEAIIRGDQNIYSIAAASIMAKVFRDNLLKRFHHIWPQYNFQKHKGYGTKEHYQLICQHGICELHRKSYRPFNNF